MHTIADKKLLMLRPNEISSSRNQPRRCFDEYGLRLLADSIAASGIIQPLAVRRTTDGYELIAGERRLRAAVMAGLRRVPCILHRTDDTTAAFFSIVENTQRADLTVFEEAEGISRMITEFGLAQSEVAARLGIAQSTLSNKLRLLRLDSVLQERIVSAGLTERHARALLRVPEEQREEILNRVIAEGLTLKQTEMLITQLLEPEAEQEQEQESEKEPEKLHDAPVRKFVIGDIRLFANSLSKLVNTMNSAGINAKTHRRETEKYIEYKVRIEKTCVDPNHYSQLKIC